MACQKVCKQGRGGIIVKVNLQSPIPTSFYITVANDAGMRLCKFTIMSSLYLVCILFGMPSLHPFTFLMFFFDNLQPVYISMEQFQTGSQNGSPFTLAIIISVSTTCNT